MLRHSDDGVHEGIRVHTGVYAEGGGAPQAGSDHLNLGIPTALWHQDVGVLCSHLEQLCWCVGGSSPKGLEVFKQCL